MGGIVQQCDMELWTSLVILLLYIVVCISCTYRGNPKLGFPLSFEFIQLPAMHVD